VQLPPGQLVTSLEVLSIGFTRLSVNAPLVPKSISKAYTPKRYTSASVKLCAIGTVALMPYSGTWQETDLIACCPKGPIPKDRMVMTAPRNAGCLAISVSKPQATKEKYSQCLVNRE
jgi:hypothetical protein